MDLRRLVQGYKEAGTLNPQIADKILCQPQTAPYYESTTVTVEPTIGAAKAQQLAAATHGCVEGSRLTGTFGLDSAAAGYYYQSINFCWDNKSHRVADWSGVCSGYTTALGSAELWNFNGCMQNDFVNYTLNGYYGGGVNHITRFQFTSNIWTVPSRNYKISSWGHYDGTCDHNANGSKVYPTCLPPPGVGAKLAALSTPLGEPSLQRRWRLASVFALLAALSSLYVSIVIPTTDTFEAHRQDGTVVIESVQHNPLAYAWMALMVAAAVAATCAMILGIIGKTNAARRALVGAAVLSLPAFIPAVLAIIALRLNRTLGQDE